MSDEPFRAPTPGRVEWPTVFLIATWAGTVAVVVVLHRSMPWYVSVPSLAVLTGFQFSLQHEVIHGHPTPWRWLNVVPVGLPLALWCPLREFRISHLRHHASELTVPGVDPESFYVTAETWDRSGPIGRGMLRLNRTLAGRLLIGPWIVVATSLSRAAGAWRDREARSTWALHVTLAVGTVWLVVGVAGLPAWEYVVGIVWGGTAFPLLRSFVEHRDTAGTGTPSAVVRSNALFSLLFLNNNLHHTHHARPGSAWYALPRLHRELGSDELARAGAGWYRGYGEIARRYLVRPFGEPVHPSECGAGLMRTGFAARAR